MDAGVGGPYDSRVGDERAQWNGCRWRAGDPGGHYESWFLRGNAPGRPFAFWIRYTIFSPRGRPGDAQGELWAIVFDGTRVRAAKQVVPIDRCSFAADALDVRIDDATLVPGTVVGAAVGDAHRIEWSLAWQGDDPPLRLLPAQLYTGGFPKAKSVIPAPLVRYTGAVTVDGERIAIDGWLGTQNHNWGERHTDRYAWAQVAGFDDHDDALLECISAKLKLGPLWTPWLTIAVLRVGERTYEFNTLGRAALAKTTVDGLRCVFTTKNGRERLRVELEGSREAFVGLRYPNPPGGEKICLNSKIARATVELDDGKGTPLRLHTEHRAAFELLGDDTQGVTVVA
jgi:hypothetical protein